MEASIPARSMEARRLAAVPSEKGRVWEFCFSFSTAPWAIASGKVAKYVTDFPSPEVLDMPNTVAIPHLGASTPESEINCACMAARELRDYIEYGVIRNSVNLPNVETLPDCKVRVCIIHDNVPSMISNITSIFGSAKINIEHLTNQSKKEMAYTVLDTNSEVTNELPGRISMTEGIIRVRKIEY